MEHYLTIFMMVLMFICAVPYFFVGNIGMGGYWVSAGFINFFILYSQGVFG